MTRLTTKRRLLCATCLDSGMSFNWNYTSDVFAKELGCFVLVCWVVCLQVYLKPYTWLRQLSKTGLQSSQLTIFTRAMLCINAVFAVARCPSVRPSWSDIVSKRLNISSKFFLMCDQYRGLCTVDLACCETHCSAVVKQLAASSVCRRPSVRPSVRPTRKPQDIGPKQNQNISFRFQYASCEDPVTVIFFVIFYKDYLDPNLDENFFLWYFVMFEISHSVAKLRMHKVKKLA